MTFLLQFIDAKSGDKHYFVRLGDHWPHCPELRLIERTTPHLKKATVFETLPAAFEVLVTAGRPQGWSVLEMEGGEAKRVIEP